MANTVQAQETVADTVKSYANEPIEDSTVVESDDNDALDKEVFYTALDSQIFNMTDKTVELYGNAEVSYGSINLKANYIKYGFLNNEVFACGLTDTAGVVIGKPIFSEGGQAYDADTIRYNFKTKKGYIKQIATQIADGHIFGKTVKKTPDDVLYIKNGAFCPCEDKDAKTLIRVNKIKVIPDKKIITGPWFLSIGKIPTPLGFFLGYFPNSKKQSSGILIPSYGESEQLGFFLLNGGWYQPLSPKADLQLTGDIYSKGSWGAKSLLRYKNRYKYNGNLDLTYNVNKTNSKDFPDFQENRNFFVRWSHIKDGKSRPGTSFSADVNAGSSQAFTNNLNTNINDYLSNTFRSNVSYSKSFIGTPINLSISANHTQNTLDRTFTVSLPEAALNVSRIYIPLSFLKSENDLKTRWFEKIGVNYSTNFTNRLSTTEDQLRADNWDYLKTQINNGLRHTANVSTSLKAGPVTVNPRASFTDRMYFRTLKKFYDNEVQQAVTDTIPGFSNTLDYNFGVNFTTQLYGMYTYKKGPIKAIRHQFTPSFTLNYNPDFSTREYGYTGANGSFSSYSPYQLGPYGIPPEGESGGFTINLQNNLEAKIKSKSDSITGFKKVKLIEGFNIAASHNLIADSLKWTDIALNGRTTLFKNLSLNYRGVYDPYSFNDSTGVKLNESLYSATGKLARMKSTTLAATWGFRLGGKEPKNENLKEIKPLNYVSKNIAFSSNLSYNINLNRRFINGVDSVVTTQSISASGSLDFFNKVKIGYLTGYDYVQKELTPTTFNLYVDLNCWEFKATVVPFGIRKSYYLSLNMKSAILKDVKLERRRNLTQNNLLY